MRWLMFLILVVAVLAFLALKRRKPSTSEQDVELPYVLGGKLFSPA